MSDITPARIRRIAKYFSDCSDVTNFNRGYDLRIAADQMEQAEVEIKRLTAEIDTIKSSYRQGSKFMVDAISQIRKTNRLLMTEVNQLHPLAKIGAAIQRLEEWWAKKYENEYRIDSVSTGGDDTLFQVTLWDFRDPHHDYVARAIRRDLSDAVDAVINGVE